VHVPQDQGIDLKRDPGDHACYIPSKIVHTWTGHTKGVNAIRFFPRAGHLLLSASNDEKVKVRSNMARYLTNTFADIWLRYGMYIMIGGVSEHILAMRKPSEIYVSVMMAGNF